MRELAKSDGGGIAVAGDAEIDQIAVGEVGARQHRRHAAVHGIESVRITEEIVGRLRGAADARDLCHPMRLDRELVAGLDDRGGDRVMAATRAEGGDLALVVTMGETERVLRQAGMMEFGLGNIGHDTALRRGVTLRRSWWSPIAFAIKRAVIGVPS